MDYIPGIGEYAQTNIVNKSPYIEYYMREDSRGRKPILANEQFDYSRNNLIGITMIDKSQFFLLPTYFPEIYVLHPNQNLRRGIKGCIDYICSMTTEVSGISNLELNSIDIDAKTPFFNVPIITNITGVTREINLTVPSDLAGFFITEQIRHWMNQISDEYSKSACYNGLNIEYNNWSHSCGMAYIKPDKTWTRVDYGCLMFLMIPKVAITENWNSSAGDTSAATLPLRFTCSIIDHRNQQVNALLEAILKLYRALIVRDASMYGRDGTGTFFAMTDNITAPQTVYNIRDYS